MLFFGFPDLQRKMLTHFPWFLLDFVTFSAGFLGFSQVFVRFTHAFHAFFDGFSRIFYVFSSNAGLVAAWSLPVPLGFPRFSN